MSKVKIGIVGSRFQADCIAASVHAMPEEAEVVAVASPTRGNAEAFARRHGIASHYVDYREMLRNPAIELVSVTAPNRLHAQITIDAARAGKHVVCEKPLCVTLEEADAMIEACTSAGVHLLYGEELFFAHVHLHGGPAPVRRYLPDLIDLVLNGTINPGKVFDLTLPLAEVAEGYRAMDERRAIKALLRP